MPLARQNSSTPWLADLRYQILDLAVRVRCSDRVVATRLSQLLDFFATEDPIVVPPRNTYFLAETDDGRTRSLTRNGDLLARSEAWAPLIATLVADLNTSAVAEMHCFAAHSGAVARADGVVAFPSESGGGKSTLTAACLLTGFEYVSDEALCLDHENGQVLPYPKPISLDSWSMGALNLPSASLASGEVLFSPRDLGAVAVPGKVPLRHVVLMERSYGDPELIELPRSEIVASLLRASFNHYKRPEESFRLLTAIAPACRVWRLRLGDPMAAAHMLRDRLNNS